MPGTNRETLLPKVKDICHIICLTNVSVCDIVLPVSANGESVSSNVCEFGRKYFIIFAFREANFVSSIKANVSRCGRQGTTWAYGPNLVWGGGGAQISLPYRFAYTVHIYNFVRDFTRAAFF